MSKVPVTPELKGQVDTNTTDISTLQSQVGAPLNIQFSGDMSTSIFGQGISPATVNNSSVVITPATTGKVRLYLQPILQAGALPQFSVSANTGIVSILRNGTPILEFSASAPQSFAGASFVDTAAGTSTVTYSITFAATSGTADLSVNKMNLVAQEV